MPSKPDKFKVAVVMPAVKLNLQDLAYMNSLLSGGIGCHTAPQTINKLRFLDLIVEGEIKPCPKTLAAFVKVQDDHKAAIKAAVKAENWDEVYSHSNRLKYDRPPATQKGYVLTPAGLTFMKHGKASTTTAKKGGC